MLLNDFLLLILDSLIITKNSSLAETEIRHMC